jgi:peptidoglycan/LPS O-acetylase OafA/YrhL
MQQLSQQNHLKYDVMRGAAALIVLFSHTISVFIKRLFPVDVDAFIVFSTLARHAVLIFFLLSGYLITKSIISNVKRNKGFDVISYLSSRITRIYPPLIGSMLIVIACWALIFTFDLPGKFQYGLPTDIFIMRQKFTFEMYDIYLMLTMQNGMLQTNGPLWSLNIEFIIYIFVMTLTLSFLEKSKLLTCCYIALTAIIFLHGIKINSHFIFFLLIWALGASVNLFSYLPNIKNTRFYASFPAAIMWLAFIALIIFGFNNWYDLLVTDDAKISQKITQILFCLIYTYVIFISNILDRVKSKMLVTAGSFSYSLYIVHFPILLFIYSLSQNWMMDSLWKSSFIAIVSIVAVIFIAVFFAKYFEGQARFKPAVLTMLSLINRQINKVVSLVKG